MTLSMPLHDSRGPHPAMNWPLRFRDGSGTHDVVVSSPEAAPELWTRYLDSAFNAYRARGVERALDLNSMRTAALTSFFFAILDMSGNLVGGARVQGPYTVARQAHALTEWGGRTGSSELRAEITSRLPAGVIEVKTVWANTSSSTMPKFASEAVARVYGHALSISQARFALCTTAEHAVPRWSSGGGVVCTSVAPVCYPDPRYRTVPMWWDRSTMKSLMTPRQRVSFSLENAALMSQLPSGDLDQWPSVA